MSGTTYAPVERIVEVVGLAAALRLAERFGGRRLYVPQPERLKAESPLAAVLGFDLAQKFAFEWRGMEIVVPRCVEYLRRARDRQIHLDAKSMSAAEIAAKHGMTERHVFRVLAEAAPAAEADAAAASSQRSLFG